VGLMLGRRGRFMAHCRLMPHGLLMPLHRLFLGNGHRGVGFAAHCGARSALHALPDYFGHRIINGAGVRLFLGDVELGQHVDNGVRGNLKLPG
jgi:hypothetical protein